MSFPPSYGDGFHSRPSRVNPRQPLFGGQGRDDGVQVAIEPSVAWDDEIDQLRAGVSRLKQVSTTIQDESQITSQLLGNLENAMEAARLTLRQAMKRLGRAYKQSKSNHMIYLFVFALAMFFAVFFWSKVYRFFKWIL